MKFAIALALILCASPAFAFGGRVVSRQRIVQRQQVVVQRVRVQQVRQVQQVYAQPVVVQSFVHPVYAQPIIQQQIVAPGCSALFVK
jgi:hypothetical protein